MLLQLEKNIFKLLKLLSENFNIYYFSFFSTIGLFILIPHSSLSQIKVPQISSADEFCGTYDISKRKFEKNIWFGDNAYLFNLLDSIRSNENDEDSSKIYYRIPIKFWIYQTRKGKGGLSEKGLKQTIYELNKYNSFNNTGFRYYMRPDVRYIKKNRHTVFGFYIEPSVQTFIHHTKDCINVHIVDNMVRKTIIPGKRTRSYRGNYNYITKGIVLRKISSTTTLTHEIGHYFGLLHPFRNWDKGKCQQESVSRTRKYKGCLKHGVICEKSGDGLSDTPAEPRLSGLIDDNCKYIGELYDNWGDRYIPDTHNIMSYPGTMKCREIFTPGQIAIMLHTAKKINICGWDMNCNEEYSYKHQYNFDIYEPDNSQEMSNKLSFHTSQYHTFHKTYMGKHKNDYENDVDWYNFRINQKKIQNIKIEIYQNSNTYTEIDLTIFDQNKNNLLAIKNTIGKKSIWKIENLKNGIYYIKTSKKNLIYSPDIGDYNIIIDNF